MSELAQRILIAGANVGKVIYLDAEGGGILYEDASFSAWTPITDSAWTGPETDNYYSSYLDLLGGHSVDGANNFDDGTEYSHTDLPLKKGFPHYLIGDVDNGANDGLYIENGVIVTKDILSYSSGTKDPYSYDPPTSLELFNGNFEYEDSTAGWWWHGGGTDLASSGGGWVINGELHLHTGESRTHNWTYVPSAEYIKFDIEVYGDCELQIKWAGPDGNFSVIATLAFSDGDAKTVTRSIGSINGVGRIQFELTAPGLARAEIDNIGWLAELPLIVESLPSDSEEQGEVKTVTNEEVATTAAHALARLDSHGWIIADSIRLDDAYYSIRDLNDGVLALTEPGGIVLDDDAAGYGWFIDDTPWDNEEFTNTVYDWELHADADSPAAGKIDLLTVLMHEMGHVMGLPDVSAGIDPTRLMTGILAPGVRRLPSELDLAMLTPEPGSPDADPSTGLVAVDYSDFIRRINQFREDQNSVAEALHQDTYDLDDLRIGITNGTFSIADEKDPGFGWSLMSDASVQDGVAVLDEGRAFFSGMSQTFIIPSGAERLRFVVDSAVLGATTGNPGDAFEVALLNADTMTSLVGTAAGLDNTDAFLNIQGNGTTYISPAVSIAGLNASGDVLSLADSIAVEIDLSGVPPGTVAALYFDLLGFGEVDSRVIIDNVFILTGAEVPPIAVSDTVTTYVNDEIIIDILANDVDPDGDIDPSSMVIVAGTEPEHGSIAVNYQTGIVTYQPQTDYYGEDAFGYTVQDNSGIESNEATVTINVRRHNTLSDVRADTYICSEDTALVAGPQAGVLANDTDADGHSLIAILVQGPAHGSLTLNADGSFEYIPNQDFHGDDSFAYKVYDGIDESNQATVDITVEPVNDDPVTGADRYVVREDGTLTTPAPGILFNDSDLDGDSLAATLETIDPAYGQVAVNADGSFTYTPAENFFGIATFTYLVEDGHGGQAAGTATITVNPVNDAPIAVDDTYPINEGAILAVNLANGVLANDSDVDGDLLEASLESGPANGTITLNSNGSFEYIATDYFNGDDSFTYLIADGNGGTSTAVVSVTVNPVNDPPVGVDDLYVTDEDMSLVVDVLQGVLSNDYDVDSGSLTAELLADVSHGTLTLSSNGSFQYIPDPDFRGLETFTYQASDGSADSNETAVMIVVNPINDTPVAVDDTYSVDEDITLTVDAASGVLANDSDIDNDTLAVVLLTDVAHGDLSLNSDGSFDYVPDSEFNGTDSFTYRASDGRGGEVSATVTITVNPINDVPMAADDAYSVDEDTILAVDAATGVLVNDTDIEGNPLTAALESGPTNGILVMNSDGSFEYAPDDDFHGQDSFGYWVDDGNGGQTLATAVITINPIADSPVAVDDGYTTNEDTSLNTDVAQGVLANDNDVDGDPLTAELLTDVSHGVLTFDSNGSFQYIPEANFHGLDSFTYQVNDGSNNSNETTVTITVNPINDVPVALDDTYSMADEAALVVYAAEGVLANDNDVDGDALTASVESGPANGSLTLNADGSFTYTRAGGFAGDDSFTYRTSDGHGGQAVAAVVIAVNPLNQAPVTNNDTYDVDEDSGLSVDASAGVLSNDEDVNNDVLTAALIGGPSHGALTLNSNGSFSYTPATDFNGADSFTYRASDGQGGSATGIVSIMVNPVNDVPVAMDDAYTIDEDDTLTVDAAAGVLANDSDVDGNPLTAALVTGPAHGTLSLNPDGSFEYTPHSNYSGSDSFTYVVSDGQGGTDTATVVININEINQAPQVETEHDGITVNEGDVTENTGTFADLDQGDVVQITASIGTITQIGSQVGTWTWSFTTMDGPADAQTVTITATDQSGATAQTTFDLTVSNVPPTFEAGANETLLPADSGLFTRASISFTDPGADQWTGTVNYGGLGGDQALSIDAIGMTFGLNHTYTAEDTYTVTVTVTDDDADTHTDTFDVEVHLNHAPVADANGPYVIDEGADLHLDGSGSSDPDTAAGDRIVLYEWDLNNHLTEATPTVPWDDLSDLPMGVAHPISLRVTDSFGVTDTDTTALTVYRNQPVAVISASPNPAAPGQQVTSDASASTHGRPDRTIVQYEWDFDYDGSFDVDGSGVQVTHAYTQFGQYTAALRVTDDNAPALTDITTVVVDISLGNNPPVADPNGPYQIDVGDDLQLDGSGSSDPNESAGDSIVSYQWDIGGDGSYEYTSLTPTVPWADLSSLPLGTAHTIRLLVTDSFGATDTDTTTLTICRNQPVAVISASPNPAAYGQQVTFDGSGSTHGRPDRSIVQYELDFEYDGLTFDVDANGAQVTHAYGQFGSYTAALRVTDDNAPAKTDIATVMIDISLGNNPPVADANGPYVIDEGDDLQLDGSGSSDPDEAAGDSIVLHEWDLFHELTEGTPTVPWSDLSDLALDVVHTISLRVTDSFGATGTDSATLTINHVNTPPVANDDAITTNEDTPVTYNVLSNDYDVDGDALIVSSFTNGVNGTVQINVDNTVTYTPAQDYFGPDSFTYYLSDGNGGEDTATVNITVTPVNDAPKVSDPGEQFSRELDVVSLQILASDPDGDALTYSAQGLPDGLSVDPVTGLISGELSYDSAGFHEVFVVVTDGQSSVESGFPWTVTNTNRAPVANDDDAATDEDTPVTIHVLANDSDGDGDALSLGLLDISATPGLVTVNADDTLTYDPNGRFEHLNDGDTATDTFIYTIGDGNGGSDTATVTVTITGVNDAPVDIELDDSSISENQPSGTFVGSFSTADPDVGDSHTYSLVPGAVHNASFALNGNQLVSTEVFDFETQNSYSILVRSTDDGGLSREETFDIEINNVNEGAGLVINEIDSDTPGTDTVEFVELYDGGSGNTPLDGLVIVFYNGNGDVSYRAIDLDDYSTNAEGFFVIGNAGVPNVDLVFTNDNNNLQNGPDAVALYEGSAVDFPNGTPVTIAGLVDAVVYDTNDDDDAGLLPLLNAGQPQVDEAGGAGSAVDSLSRRPDGGAQRDTSTYVPQEPTPGQTNVIVPRVDLVVTKTESVDPVVAGSGAGNLVYVVTVTNAGPSDATGVTLSEAVTLPAGVTIVSITPSTGTYLPANDPNGTWSVGNLDAGASETLTIVMTVGAGTADGAIVSDTATVTGVNETLINTGDDTATENTTVQQRVDLQVSKLDTPDPVTAGSGPSNLTHTVTVTNAGPSNASGVTLSESVSLPAGVSIVSITPSGATSYAPADTSPGTWTVGNLAVGASETLTIVMTVGGSTADGAVVSDTATVTAVNETLINTGDDTATENTTVQRRVDLQVSKLDTPDPVTAGSGPSNLTHTVTVTNAGPSDASGVTLSESVSLPAGASIVSITPSGTTTYAPADTSPGTWTVGNLAVGASETLTIVMTVGDSTADGAIVSDAATVTAANETLINTGDDSATENTTVQRRVDLQVSKLDTPDPVTAGSGPDNLTHTVTVTNAGPSDASGVTLSETVSLPAGASIVSITPSGTTTYAPADTSPGTWIVGNLASGASETLTIVMTVRASTADGAIVSDTATVTAVNETLINTGDDSATENTTVQRTSQESQLASDLVSMQASGLRYNRRTGVMSSYITITNTSSQAIRGDVHFVINSLSDTNVNLVGGDGTTATGQTYYDLTPYLNDGRLDPGESVTIRLDFYNPLRRRFTFEWDLWGRIG